MAQANYKKIKKVFEDIDREVVKGEEIVIDKIDAKTQQRIVEQIDNEYDVSYSFNEAKRKTMLQRLKLYNNQRRVAESVGDPLMFTVFNTVHAALYEDRLNTLWEGRGGKGDEDIEENLNVLSNFDYDLMGKEQLDYFWNWDAEFFGRGLVLLMEFDRSEGIMAPVPENIPATSWVRDPRASSVNGNLISGKGAMRFGGYETGVTYYELKDLPGYFNINSLRKDKEVQSLIDEIRDAHHEAQGTERYNDKLETLSKFGNYEFQLLNWFTTIRGKKYLVTLGNRRTTLVRLIEIKGNRWPVIDRSLYPMSDDWDGVSIPDLTEDKQRARAVLINLGLKGAKADVLPNYLYDKTRIKNKNELNLRFNKFIGVDGRVDNALIPVQKSVIHQYVVGIMDMLDTAAQRATAASEIRQGIQPEKDRTLGENQLVLAGGENRFSMSAKIYGWSEKAFWRQWYFLYKTYFKDRIDEKVVRISGTFAPTWRPLLKDNIIASVDPDVKIESRIVSEAKNQRKLQQFIPIAGLLLQDPTNNRRTIQKRLAKLNGSTKEEIDMMFSPTIDEIQAEEENLAINNESLPKINIQDDHLIHLEIHSKANQNPYAIAHIRAHKRLMVEKRNRPELFAMQPQPEFKIPAGTQPKTENISTPKVPANATI